MPLQPEASAPATPDRERRQGLSSTPVPTFAAPGDGRRPALVHESRITLAEAARTARPGPPR